eukprot:365994-Chlamydomonas_euryale.AAC.11
MGRMAHARGGCGQQMRGVLPAGSSRHAPPVACGWRAAVERWRAAVGAATAPRSTAPRMAAARPRRRRHALPRTVKGSSLRRTGSVRMRCVRPGPSAPDAGAAHVRQILAGAYAVAAEGS